MGLIMFGFIVASPILTKNFAHISYCDYHCQSFKLAKSAKIFPICDFLFLYIFPFISILIHYIITSKFLLQSTQNFQNNNTIRRQTKSRRKLAYISITMSIFFCIFWLPYYVYNFILRFKLHDVSNYPSFIPFRHVHYYMSLANSSLNPWLLFMISSTHRKRLITYLRCESGPNQLPLQTKWQTTLTMKLFDMFPCKSSPRVTSLGKSGSRINMSSPKSGSARCVNVAAVLSATFQKKRFVWKSE